MTDPSPFAGQPQEPQRSGTIYHYQPNPVKRAALFALFARIKARLAAEKAEASSGDNP